jgi:hypothetical protein
VAAAQNAGVAIYGATYSAMKTGFTASRADWADYETPGQRKRAPLPSEAPGAMPGEEKGKLPPPEQRFDILGSIVELVRLGSTKTTEVLTVATGGATFSFARQKTLEAALTRLGEELHSGYLLSFVPEGAEPGYHKIDVRLTRRGDCRVRARPAYWFAEDGVERASDPAR